MYYTIAFRNLTKRKVRTILSALGIMIGVAMIISLVSVSDGLKKTTGDFSKALGNTIFIAAEGTFGPPSSSILDIKIVDDIEKIPGVEAVAPLIMIIGTVDGYTSKGGSFEGSSSSVGLVGIDPLKDRIIESDYTKIVSGRFLKEDERGGAIIGLSLANDMNKRVGDTVTFAYNGNKYDFDIVGIYDPGTSSQTSSGVVVTLRDVQIVGDLPNYRINAVRVLPVNQDRTDELQKKIRMTIPGVDPTYATSLVSTLNSFTSTLQIVTWAIAGIAAFIGGVGIMNTMVMSVMEQTKEIGVLKAVGWSDGSVLGLVLMESVGLSIIGAALGLAIGCLTVLVVLPLIFKGALSPVLTVTTVVEAVLFALVLGAAGGYLPARRAASLDPVEAFRSE